MMCLTKVTPSGSVVTPSTAERPERSRDRNQQSVRAARLPILKTVPPNFTDGPLSIIGCTTQPECERA